MAASRLHRPLHHACVFGDADRGIGCALRWLEIVGSLARKGEVGTGNHMHCYDVRDLGLFPTERHRNRDVAALHYGRCDMGYRCDGRHSRDLKLDSLGLDHKFADTAQHCLFSLGSSDTGTDGPSRTLLSRDVLLYGWQPHYGHVRPCRASLC